MHPEKAAYSRRFRTTPALSPESRRQRFSKSAEVWECCFSAHKDRKPPPSREAPPAPPSSS